MHDFADFDLRKSLRQFVVAANPSGLFMEFGVFRGLSIRSIANMVPQKTVYGFDSFKGLPERWADTPKGAFKCPPPTDLPSNVKLVVGLFQETLPGFLRRRDGHLIDPPEPVSFVHIDCDLYSSTKFVLDTLRNRLDGAIVVFDEITGSAAAEDHEGRALKDFLQETGAKAELLANHHRYGAGYRMRL